MAIYLIKNAILRTLNHRNQKDMSLRGADPAKLRRKKIFLKMNILTIPSGIMKRSASLH
jgi:hypothetical protein